MLTKADFNVPVEHSVREDCHPDCIDPFWYTLPLAVCYEILATQEYSLEFNYHTHPDYGLAIDETGDVQRYRMDVWNSYSLMIRHILSSIPGDHYGKAWVAWNTWAICLEGTRSVTYREKEYLEF